MRVELKPSVGIEIAAEVFAERFVDSIEIGVVDIAVGHEAADLESTMLAEMTVARREARQVGGVEMRRDGDVAIAREALVIGKRKLDAVDAGNAEFGDQETRDPAERTGIADREDGQQRQVEPEDAEASPAEDQSARVGLSDDLCGGNAPGEGFAIGRAGRVGCVIDAHVAILEPAHIARDPPSRLERKQEIVDRRGFERVVEENAVADQLVAGRRAQHDVTLGYHGSGGAVPAQPVGGKCIAFLPHPHAS